MGGIHAVNLSGKRPENRNLPASPRGDCHSILEGLLNRITGIKAHHNFLKLPSLNIPRKQISAMLPPRVSGASGSGICLHTLLLHPHPLW